jgi:hypothetical protein
MNAFKIVIILILLFYLNTYNTGIRNFLIGNIIGNINTYITLKGEYKEQQLIDVLNSYNIFDFYLFGSLLVSNKSKTKSYEIIETDKQLKMSSKKLLALRIQKRLKNYYTIEILFNHIVFDMQGIFNIIENYLKNNTTTKKIKIYKKFHLTDLSVFSKFLSLFDKIICKNEVQIISKDFIQQQKFNLSLSSLDLVFAVLILKYLVDSNKEKCVVTIVRSNRTCPIKIGNNLSLHNVLIIKNDIKNIAEQIRKSYLQQSYKYTLGNIWITSWIPHKGMNIYNFIISNGIIKTDNYDFYNFCDQIITVSLYRNNYFCDIQKKIET